MSINLNDKLTKNLLGQNSLVDKNIITKILKLSEIKNNNIVEIGPEKGALTDEILCKTQIFNFDLRKITK